MGEMRGASVGLAEPLWAELSALLGDRLTRAGAVREQHGRDESWHPVKAPDAVCFPTSTEEVSAIVAACARTGTPVVPFGAGTSLEGHVGAVMGGLCVDLSRMNEILRVSPEDLDVTVQAGVSRKQLNIWLRDTGLFFPVDPGADATLGGMASTRASGTNAVRYGTMRENVLGLTVVTADGRVIRTGGRARLTSPGYHPTLPFLGAKRTPGLITEVTVRLYGIPAAVSAAACAFPDIGAAVDTAIAAIQSGIPVSRVELVDTLLLDAINRHAGLDYKVAPTLFFEFVGTPAGVQEQAEMVAELARDFGGEDFRWATDADARAKLWQARHEAHYATMAIRPGARAMGTDVCVPISRLSECIVETKKDMDAASFPVTLVGHVGDGNFHLGLVIDPDDPAEVAEAKAIADRLVLRALDMDGTCTGEHGIGQGKRRYMEAEHGEAVELMRVLKNAIDPKGIMNPGKVLP